MKTSFFTNLYNTFGQVLISDEEKSGYGEIYWRLVRPNFSNDVGPLHSDSWFWELGHGKMPDGYKRVKFWFAIYCEPDYAGLKYVEDSYKVKYQYQSKMKDGMIKPVFDEKEFGLKTKLFNTSAGGFISFNDNLLHGGSIGGTMTRVSFEFTLFVKDSFISKLANN